MEQKYDRIELGVDGNAAFALLGPNIQEGECEFVTIPETDDPFGQALVCCKMALHLLRVKLNRPDLSFYFGQSHPYGT